MNELILSNDLEKIEFEINYHKQVAGQSIWEIGRRLNHVKENDLVHGQFVEWVENIGMDRSEAYRFMRVAKELPNVETFQHLGSTALYLISTLPEEERDTTHTLPTGEAKTVDEMTVRELQEVKRQLNQKDLQLKQQFQEIKRLKNKPPEVVEREVIPEDYQFVKSENEHLSNELEKLQEDNRRTNEQLTKWMRERKSVDEQSEKYEQLSKAISNAEEKLSGKQKLISNYHNLSELLRKSNDFLSVASSILYQDLSEVTTRDSLAKQELGFLVERTERFLGDLKKLMDEQSIIEGEIIYE